MKYKKMKEGIFLSRPNRFIANVIVDGEIQTVHVKNTGRCKELLMEGVRVYLEDHGEGPTTRKTRYSLAALDKKDSTFEAGIQLVNIDSYAPNRVVGEALSAGTLVLPGLSYPLQLVKAETTYGDSRFDFYLEDQEGRKAYAEVKGVTLAVEGIARFPDAPTERGLKHLEELCRARADDFLSYAIFVIQMKGVHAFEPNDATHPAFGEALRKAQKQGVEILAFDCMVKPDQLVLDAPISVRL